MTLNGNISRYFSEYPVLVTALGLGPLLANSSTLLSALTISLGFASVLFCSSITLSLIRKLVPHRFRLVFILLISSVWVSVFDLLLQAYVYEMSLALGIYIPLLVMNSLILMLLEKGSLVTGLPGMAIKSLLISIVPVCICLLTGIVRELLVHGAVLTDRSMFYAGSTDTVRSGGVVLLLFDTVAGAFLITGCLLAMVNYLCSGKQGKLLQAEADDRS